MDSRRKIELHRAINDIRIRNNKSGVSFEEFERRILEFRCVACGHGYGLRNRRYDDLEYKICSSCLGR